MDALKRKVIQRVERGITREFTRHPDDPDIGVYEVWPTHGTQEMVVKVKTLRAGTRYFKVRISEQM